MRVNHCAVRGAFFSPHVLLRWLQAVTFVMFAYHSAAQQDLPVAKFLQIGSRRSQGVLAFKERAQQTPEQKTEEEAEEAKEEPTEESKEDAKEEVEEELEEEIEKEVKEEEVKAALGGDETAESEGAAAEEILSSLSAQGNPKKEGNEMLKELVESETPDSEPGIKKEDEIEEEEPDPIEIAQKKLFDEPAEKKYGHKVEPEEGEEEAHELKFHYPHDGGHGHAVEHESHAMPIPLSVKCILVFTPIMVLSTIAYFFCVSNVSMDSEVLNAFAKKEVNVKLHELSQGWRRILGKIMEHPVVNFAILAFILIDLCCAVVHDVLHQTDLLNPKYHEQREQLVHNTHQLSVYILCGFLIEQLVHISVFGKLFFYHFWYVLDLIVCYTSLLGETVLNEKYGEAISFLILMRLWKVVAVIFDFFLANAQTKELTERIEKRKSRMNVGSP